MTKTELNEVLSVNGLWDFEVGDKVVRGTDTRTVYTVTKLNAYDNGLLYLIEEDCDHCVFAWCWEVNKLEDVLNVEYEANLSDSYYDDEYGNHVDEWGEIL